MASSAPTYFTAEMVRVLLDESRAWPRYETVHGELLVTPSPSVRHQLLVARLFAALSEYLRREPVGLALTSPADISWGRDDVLVQPDVFVADTEQLRTLRWRRVARLLLAAEVLSSSSLRADRFTKRTLYQTQQVDTYWVVDDEARTVEIWSPEDVLPRLEERVVRWHPAGAATELVVDLDALFAPV